MMPVVTITPAMLSKEAIAAESAHEETIDVKDVMRLNQRGYHVASI